MKSRLARVGVVMTALLCLGVAGYAGQVWWAKRVAMERMSSTAYDDIAGLGQPAPVAISRQKRSEASRLLASWSDSSWHGDWKEGGWWPRQGYYERLRIITGLDLPNDRSAWEAWFKAHPDLVWDDNLKQLVQRKP